MSAARRYFLFTLPDGKPAMAYRKEECVIVIIIGTGMEVNLNDLVCMPDGKRSLIAKSVADLQ